MTLSVQLATLWNSTTPAAPSGRLNLKPATDGLTPVADSSWSMPNHGQVESRSTTTETIGQADQGKIIKFTNAAATAVTISTPTDATWMCYVAVQGAGTCTFTPASGTISYGATTGASSVALNSGQDGVFFWDGTNYELMLIGSAISLQTNGVANASQSTLNLVSGTGITLTNTSLGNVQVSALGAGAGTQPFTNMLAPTSGSPPPALGSLTWGNQGTATASANSGGALYFSDTAAATNLRFLYKAAPATPWTFDIGMVASLRTSASVSTGGIFLRESATGKIIVFTIGGDGTTGRTFMAIQKYTNYTTLNSSYFQNDTPVQYVNWMQVNNDGTHLTWSTAVDGQNYKTTLQKTLTDFFTTGPDQVGIGIYPAVATWTTDALFVYWSGI